MCKVIINKPYENIPFILYNHIYSRKSDTFSLEELSHEICRYELYLDAKDLEDELYHYLENGMLSKRGFGKNEYYQLNRYMF